MHVSVCAATMTSYIWDSLQGWYPRKTKMRVKVRMSLPVRPLFQCLPGFSFIGWVCLLKSLFFCFLITNVVREITGFNLDATSYFLFQFTHPEFFCFACIYNSWLWSQTALKWRLMPAEVFRSACQVSAACLKAQFPLKFMRPGLFSTYISLILHVST